MGELLCIVANIVAVDQTNHREKSQEMKGMIHTSTMTKALTLVRKLAPCDFLVNYGQHVFKVLLENGYVFEIISENESEFLV